MVTRRTRAASPHTDLIEGPDGPLEVLRVGEGRPHTLFVHGLAGSIGTTRPYGTRVAGRKAFVHLRGHGRSHVPPGAWGYAELAAEVWAVADHPDVLADRALGISMGAGALMRGLASEPHRFDRVVLVLPAALDQPRDDVAMAALEGLAERVESGDPEAVADHLVADQPPAVQEDPALRTWALGQAEILLASGVASALRVLPSQVPLVDREVLREVTCPVLVLGQEGDATHPAAIAHEVAELLPDATLHIAGGGGLMWEERDRTRELVGEFLSAP
ncbi:alpha/beta fold hydrolase [Ornithinimicrobium sp. Y1847]|uniref:alpha/beta fold hydrolase n=1 Tax=unclassified Ornithinimicrobium TaxID=2615080 RepID=UPI003B67B66F